MVRCYKERRIRSQETILYSFIINNYFLVIISDPFPSKDKRQLHTVFYFAVTSVTLL